MRRHFWLPGWLAILVLAFSSSVAWAGHVHPEKYYQKIWCQYENGALEVVLSDETRCDCVTATHAVEFDFGHKWAESIGQALNYSRLTGKKPGVVLIQEDAQDAKYVEKVQQISDHFNLGIQVWTMQAKP